MPEIYADSIEAKVDGTNQIVPIRDITKAPAITESTSGESIKLSDSADAPLTDIKLYGKSKQDGEPSPDNPVEIEIPGSDGNVEITASDGDEQIKNVTLPTPNGLPGIPVTSGGNYTDADGQQWICDEIDYARGKYVQRIVKAVYDGSDDEDWKLNVQSENWNRYYIGLRTSVLDSNSNNIHSMNTNFQIGAQGSTVNTKNVYTIMNSGFWLSMNGTETFEEFKSYLSLKPMTLYFILATPIETDLTTEQLTAIKQLRTYQTVTNITTDSEPQVGMEVEYTADTKTWIENKFTELAQSLAATQNTLLQEV